MWHLLTSETPPDCGGVGHYSLLFAEELRRQGHPATIWSPQRGTSAAADGVERVANMLGPFGALRLARRLDVHPGRKSILLQYVPHGWGWRGMNLGLCFWLLWRSWIRRDEVNVMFHEVAMPFVKWPWRHNVQAIVQRVMAILLLLAASKVYVSTPAFSPILKRCGLFRHEPKWLPVPSNINKVEDAEGVQRIRRDIAAGRADAEIVGHFGTFGGEAGALTRDVLLPMLRERTSLIALMLGRGAIAFADQLKTALPPDLRDRCVARENLDERSMSLHLQACDVMLQPYPDGITTRRSTAMAALANGVALVTNLGPAAEALWNHFDNVVLAESPSQALLRNAVEATLAAGHIEGGRATLPSRFTFEYAAARVASRC